MAWTTGKRSLPRLIATATDLLLGAVFGLVLSNTAIGFFFASRAAVMLRIGNPDTVWKGPVPMILGILGPFVYVLPLSILLVLLIEPLSGASVGKQLMDLKIVACGGSTLASRSLWYRWAIKTTILWGLVVSLLSGSWVLALAVCSAGAVQLCDAFASLFTANGPAHERLSGACLARTAR